MKVKLNNVRLSFPSLFEPDGKYNKYNAVFMFAPDSAEAKAVREAIEASAIEKWKDRKKALTFIESCMRSDKSCYNTAPKVSSDTGEAYDGFEGMHWIRSSNAAQPLVIDSNKAPLSKKDGKPYAGCFVNASIDVWVQDNSYGKRINATLLGVQFARDGDAFSGGRRASETDFDEISSGTDASDLI
jgi:hypothetical protein